MLVQLPPIRPGWEASAPYGPQQPAQAALLDVQWTQQLQQCKDALDSGMQNLIQLCSESNDYPDFVSLRCDTVTSAASYGSNALCDALAAVQHLTTFTAVFQALQAHPFMQLINVNAKEIDRHLQQLKAVVAMHAQIRDAWTQLHAKVDSVGQQIQDDISAKEQEAQAMKDKEQRHATKERRFQSVKQMSLAAGGAGLQIGTTVLGITAGVAGPAAVVPLAVSAFAFAGSGVAAVVSNHHAGKASKARRLSEEASSLSSKAQHARKLIGVQLSLCVEQLLEATSILCKCLLSVESSVTVLKDGIYGCKNQSKATIQTWTGPLQLSARRLNAECQVLMDGLQCIQQRVEQLQAVQPFIASA